MKIKIIILLAISIALTASQALTEKGFSFKNIDDTKEYFRYKNNGVYLISGHRGGATKVLPENSIKTLSNTLKHTPAIFEVDPRVTKDNQVIMLHDANLERISNGTGKATDYTTPELKKFKLKGNTGELTEYTFNTLEEIIIWSRDKTVINLDIKDVGYSKKIKIVQEHKAFKHVIFTVHNAKQAADFYSENNKSLFSAWVLNEEAFTQYDQSNVPWDNILIAYVGSTITPENIKLKDKLHEKGVMVMIGTGPSYDLLDSHLREEAYQNIIESGFDIIESDKPIEVANALKILKEN